MFINTLQPALMKCQYSETCYIYVIILTAIMYIFRRLVVGTTFVVDIYGMVKMNNKY